MNTRTDTHPTSSRTLAPAHSSQHEFREPAYDCQERPDAMRLVVYVPGVSASDVEIEARGADLTITARKPHFVRVNFSALHLEGAQRDYRLRLRLGRGFDYAAMHAEMANGVLTIRLPKRNAAPHPSRLARAA